MIIVILLIIAIVIQSNNNSNDNDKNDNGANDNGQLMILILLRVILWKIFVVIILLKLMKPTHRQQQQQNKWNWKNPTVIMLIISSLIVTDMRGKMLPLENQWRPIKCINGRHIFFLFFTMKILWPINRIIKSSNKCRSDGINVACHFNRQSMSLDHTRCPCRKPLMR